MFAVSTYEEIIAREKEVENLEIVVFLFVRPTNQDAIEIINEFEYIHHNSGKYCSIYAIGYNDNPQVSSDVYYKKISGFWGNNWFFSTKAFAEFKNNLEQRIKWKYSGETELLILQNNPGGYDPLNFTNYAAIDVNKGLREGYIDSFQNFMETLMRSAKSKVTAKEAMSDLCKSRISIKDTITDAIDGSKKIPKSAKRIIKDMLFYRCANSF